MVSDKIKNKKSILFATLISLVFFINPAMADDNRKLPRPPVESSGSLIINWPMLNLSPSQRERVRILRVDFQRLSVKMKAEMDLKQLDIEKLLVAPNSDPDDIRKLLRERLSIESKLRTEALENFLSIKSLLNADQLAKLPRAVNLR